MYVSKEEWYRYLNWEFEKVFRFLCQKSRIPPGNKILDPTGFGSKMLQKITVHNTDIYLRIQLPVQI
jgi:hypothetical protein